MYIQPITNQNFLYNNVPKPKLVLGTGGMNEPVAVYDNNNNNKALQEQTLIMKIGIVAMSLVGVLLGACILNKGGSSSGAVTRQRKSINKTFNSLEKDSSIPVFEKCKSLNETLKRHLKTRIDFNNASPEIREKAGISKLDNLLLISGPPGVGKSYYAKVFAKSTNAQYMELKFADYNSRWAGEDIENLQSVFENIISSAKSNPDKKYVVVFNEIDAAIQPIEKLSNTRLAGHIMSKIEERSTLLNYLEEIKEKVPNLTFIGTTNQVPRNNGLDGAALSRFKDVIEIGFPSKENLYEALKFNIERMPIESSFVKDNSDNLLKLASKMEERKCSFRDLNAVIENSKNLYLKDLMKNKDSKYSFSYFEEALKNISLTDGELFSAK